jgi:hypothetical protein
VPVVSDSRARVDVPLVGTGRLATPPARSGRLRRVLEEDCFVVLALSFTLAAVVVAAPASMIAPDTWLALVDGRLIAQHGLPHVDHLTVWTAGVRWVDQQWLAQLGLYELVRAGGMKLAVAAALALDALALVGAVVAARRLGASARSVAAAALIPIVVGPWLLQARTQSFALPLFVAVFALLAADARKPSRRVYAAVPLLMLWANLHGSAVLGAGLLLLHGVLEAARRRPRGLIMLLAAPATLLASPYGFSLVGYYRMMLIGSPLGSYVQEWGPTHLEAGTAPFFALAFGTIYLLARRPGAVSGFERIALPVLVLLGLVAARNTIWLGLACVISLPSLFDASLGPAAVLTRGLRRINVGLSIFALAFAALVFAAIMSRPTSVLLDSWPPAGAAAAASAAGSSGRVLADDVHSDWLLWEQPQLAGRLAYDVRFELFTRHQLERLRAFRNGTAPEVGSGYRILTFPSADDRRQVHPGGRIAYRSARFVVVAR